MKLVTAAGNFLKTNLCPGRLISKMLNLRLAAAPSMTRELDITTAKELFTNTKKELSSLAADLRERQKELADKIANLESEFRTENAELLETIDLTTASSKTYEDFLRSAAIEHFNQTGEKSLDENLSVRVNTKLEYQMPIAVEWAEQNAPIMIVKAVDKKAFESLPSVLDLEFVRPIETVTAVIKGM